MAKRATAGPSPPVEVDIDQALFVYGVIPAADLDAVEGRLAGGLTGIDGQPVVLVLEGELATAATVVDLDRPPQRRADLLAYQAVLDAMAAAAPVVPVRFGTVLPDADTLVDELHVGQGEQFVRMLEGLRGRRQFNLRATPVEEAVLAEIVAGSPEVRELRELTRDVPEEASYRQRVRLGELVAWALEDRSARDADMVLATVVPLTVAHVMRSPVSAKQILDVALLVEDSRADDLVAELENLAEAVHSTIRMRLLGPLAPYDFVSEGSWD